MNALDVIEMVGNGGLTALVWFALLHAGIIFYSLASGKRFTGRQTVVIIAVATGAASALAYLGGATDIAVGVVCGALCIPLLHGIAYLVDRK